jgi:hypothetical protein
MRFLFLFSISRYREQSMIIWGQLFTLMAYVNDCLGCFTGGLPVPLLCRVLELFHHQLPHRTGDRLDRHSHRYICHMSSTTILPWRQTWQTLSQVHLSYVINYHHALETDLTDTLTGTSVLHLVLNLQYFIINCYLAWKSDHRHSHRCMCHLSSPSISPWRKTCQTISQVHLFSTKF